MPAALAKKGSMPVDEATLEGYVHAPDFPKQLEWLNTDHPLSLKDLEGKWYCLISGHSAVLIACMSFRI